MEKREDFVVDENIQSKLRIKPGTTPSKRRENNIKSTSTKIKQLPLEENDCVSPKYQIVIDESISPLHFKDQFLEKKLMDYLLN